MADKDTVLTIPGWKRRMQKDVPYIYDPTQPKTILRFTELGRHGGESVKEFWILKLKNEDRTSFIELDPRDIATLEQTIETVAEILTNNGVPVPSTWALSMVEDGDHLKFKVSSPKTKAKP
jgi:hypothetical protein